MYHLFGCSPGVVLTHSHIVWLNTELALGPYHERIPFFNLAVVVKNRYLTWIPGKWKYGRKPKRVPAWWFNVDPRIILRVASPFFPGILLENHQNPAENSRFLKERWLQIMEKESSPIILVICPDHGCCWEASFFVFGLLWFGG